MAAYEVIVDASEAAPGTVALRLGEHLWTGESDFAEVFEDVTSLESDLLLVACAVLAVDRATPRGPREKLSRRIALTVPVVNAARLTPLRQEIEIVLRELSNDSWTLELPQREGQPEAARSWAHDDGSVLAFSGGLDSLAGAIHLARSEPPPYLVSHVTMNHRTKAAQAALVAGLGELGHDCQHQQFFVSSRTDLAQDFDHDAESSQRTRSFVFLVLTALVARRIGRRELVILAENGQMAIHLPLSSARTGAFSTHTAFPDVLVYMERFLSAALGDAISIKNPFVHATKAEVIREIVEDCPELIPLSESCWKNSRLAGRATHCGECIPCFIRRIAVEANGITDATAYSVEAWDRTVPPADHDDVGWRNLVELAEFILQFESLSDAEIMDEWPELYSGHIDSHAVIAMYRRFASEGRKVLSSYPSAQELLQ